MPITKALIAAAGWSTRFLPTVKTYAKHLVPVWDKPNLQYQVEACLANGITNICIVHRPEEETIKKHFSPDQVLQEFLVKTNKTHYTDSLNNIINKINFTFLDQSPTLPYGNATPILVASEFIGSDPFVYFYGDDLIVEPEIGIFLSQMLQVFESKNPTVVAAVQQVSQEFIQKLSTVKYKPDGSVESIIEKPTENQIQSLDAMVSPFVMSNQIIDIIKNLPIERGEIWNTTAVNLLASSSLVLTCKVTDGTWTTTGDPENWLLANISQALLSKPELKQKITSLL